MQHAVGFLVLKSHAVFFRWLLHAVLPNAAHKDKLLLAVRRSPSCFLVWNVSVFARRSDCCMKRTTSKSASVQSTKELLMLTLIYWKCFYSDGIVGSVVQYLGRRQSIFTWTMEALKRRTAQFIDNTVCANAGSLKAVALWIMFAVSLFLHQQPPATRKRAVNHSLWLIKLWVFVSTILSIQLFTPGGCRTRKHHMESESGGKMATGRTPHNINIRGSVSPFGGEESGNRTWAALILIIWFPYFTLPLPAPVAPTHWGT